MAFFQSGLFHDTLGKPCVTIMARIWLFLPHDLKIGIYLSDLTEFVFFLSIASLLTVQLKKRKKFFNTFNIFSKLVQKCHFSNFFKVALLNRCIKFDLIIQKHSYEALWKWQNEKISQSLPNPRFRQEKVQNGDFLKKKTHENWNFLFV